MYSVSFTVNLEVDDLPKALRCTESLSDKLRYDPGFRNMNIKVEIVPILIPTGPMPTLSGAEEEVPAEALSEFTPL